MKPENIKTIHIVTKVWFDKVNGNSYFAQSITLNLWAKNEQTIFNDFQYGYSSYRSYALQKIADVLGCKRTDITTKKIFDITIRGCKKAELSEKVFYGSL